ncbi:MAG: hypothetical protein HYU97_07095 [Deltaproteobacteria bacterium]|nr:hypothetical protein [Deltaproteobacteria bacterium]
MGKKLELFLNTDWKGDVLPRLTKFTEKWVRIYSWSTKGSLPKGLEIKDIVMGAIEKTLAGLDEAELKKGIRRWNAEKCPNLLEFLMGIVRSDLSALAKSHDHQRTDRSEGEDDEVSKIVDVDSLSDEESYSTTNSRYEELMAALQPRIANDEEVQQVVTAMEELINSAEEPTSEAVMQLTGFQYVQYRNARRRLLAIVKTLPQARKEAI